MFLRTRNQKTTILSQHDAEDNYLKLYRNITTLSQLPISAVIPLLGTQLENEPEHSRLRPRQYYDSSLYSHLLLSVVLPHVILRIFDEVTQSSTLSLSRGAQLYHVCQITQAYEHVPRMQNRLTYNKGGGFKEAWVDGKTRIAVNHQLDN